MPKAMRARRRATRRRRRAWSRRPAVIKPCIAAPHRRGTGESDAQDARQTHHIMEWRGSGAAGRARHYAPSGGRERVGYGDADAARAHAQQHKALSPGKTIFIGPKAFGLSFIASCGAERSERPAPDVILRAVDKIAQISPFGQTRPGRTKAFVGSLRILPPRP